jgi:hypothetical protein
MTDYTPKSDPDPLDQPHGEVISEDDAKQGRRGLHMLLVLGASLLLVLVVFGGLLVFHARPATDAPHTHAAAAQTVGASTGG